MSELPHGASCCGTVATDAQPLRTMPPYLALTLGIFCISLSGIFVKIAQVPGPTAALYRMAIAAVVLLPIWLWRRPTRRPFKATAIGGAFFALDLALWNASLLLIPAANATLLANCAPIWVALGTVVLLRQPLPRGFFWALSLSVVGVLIMVGPDVWQHFSASYGVALGLLAGVAYAVYLVITERERRTLDTLSFMTVSSTVGALCLLLWCLLTNTPISGFSATSWLALLGLGLISHLTGWLAINYALGHIKAAVTSVVLLGQVLLTAMIAWPVLNEPIGWSLALGGAALLAGILMASRRERPTASEP